MSMPSHHFAQIQEVRSDIDGLAKKFHSILTTMTSPEFVAVLNRLHASATDRAEAARDPDGFLRAAGVILPAGIKAKVKDHNWCVELVHDLPKGGYVGGHYDSTHGFKSGHCS